MQFFRPTGETRFKVARTRVLERVAQSFLSDVEKIFLPGLRELRYFALRLKRCVKRRPVGCALDSAFECLPEIVLAQSQRAQRVN